MDGNKIFMFGINNIPRSIKSITNNYLNIDKYLIHNGSKLLVDILSSKIKNSKIKF